MDEKLTRDETRELIKLCQSGRLYEVRDWITAGRSIQSAAEVKTTILAVAIKTGFHSLVELIAPHETQDAKNRGLFTTISQRRLDIIELLVASGADIKAVPFVEVLRCWDPQIMRFFVDHGANIITGMPFATAFGEKIRTALRPFVECKDRFPEHRDALQEHIDRALRKFAFDGDLKWVSLLMWAGANPRSRGIRLGDESFGTEADRAEIASTALMDACYQETTDVLKRLRPDPNRDNLTELLSCAASLSRPQVVKYLLDIGATPNDKDNGGSSAIDAALLHIPNENFHAYWSKRQVSVWDVRRTFEALLELVTRGALWKPDNPTKMDYVRKGLYRAEPEVTVQLLQMLTKAKCCSYETIHELFRTPRMRLHLKPCEKKLLRLGYDLRTTRERADHARLETQRRVITLLSLYNRETLYDEVWAEPIITVAKRYNLSDVRLGKICRELNIPKPGLGYWAKKAAGKPVGKRPLLPPM